MGSLRVVLARENARRDRFQKQHRVEPNHEVPGLELTDRTDNENLDFRYLL